MTEGTSSPSPTSPPNETDQAVLDAIREMPKTKYPDLYAAIVEWCTAQSVDHLYELRKNGAGVQIIYTYEPEVYKQVLAMVVEVANGRDDIKGDARRPYVTMLVASGLISLNQAGDLFGVSKATMTALRVPRPSRFPVRRLGGTLNVASVPALMSWWAARQEQPDKAHGPLIAAAVQAGTDWPIVARFTVRTVSAAKKAAAPTKEGKSVVVLESYSGPAREAVADSGGHPAGSGEGAAPVDFAGFPDDEPEFVLKSAPFGGGDAFVRASDLLAVNEADAGDAGHADGLEAGVFEGFEGDSGEHEGGSGRGVHPFLQP